VKRLGSAAGRCLVVVACLLVALACAAGPMLAADPSASPASGDVRSSATAPGLVGDPLFAVAGALAIGLAAAGATLVYIRLTDRR
jgi:hypothetical protein